MQTCRLIYRSISCDELLQTDALSRLENNAANYNRRYGVSGILILSDDRFLQVLEGPSKFVNRIYAKIVKDAKHHDVELISYEAVAKPEFHDWEMKLFKLDTLDDSVRELLADKYPMDGDNIQFVDDPILMTSLLLDMKHLQSKM